jgi:hypothetical protein
MSEALTSEVPPPIQNDFLFNRKADGNAVHLKQMEDRILNLANISPNIEIILLSVGVVYGSSEYHLQDLFKTAFDNLPLEYPLPLIKSHKSNFTKKKSSENQIISQSISKPSTVKSKFSKVKSAQEEIHAKNIGVINSKKLSEFVFMICDEDIPASYEDLPEEIRDNTVTPEMLKDNEYLKKNYVHLHYSKKIAKEYVQLRKGIRKERVDQNTFSIVAASNGDYSNSNSNQNKSNASAKVNTDSKQSLSQSKHPENEKEVENEKLEKQKKSLEEASEIIKHKESLNQSKVSKTQKSGMSSNPKSSTMFALSKLSFVSEKKKGYFDYIDQIFGKTYQATPRKSAESVPISFAKNKSFRFWKSCRPFRKVSETGRSDPQRVANSTTLSSAICPP